MSWAGARSNPLLAHPAAPRLYEYEENSSPFQSTFTR